MKNLDYHLITICSQFFDVRKIDFQVMYLSSNLHLVHAIVKIEMSPILCSLSKYNAKCFCGWGEKTVTFPSTARLCYLPKYTNSTVWY